MKISTKIFVIIRLSSLNTSIIYIKRSLNIGKKLNLRKTRRAEVGGGDRGRMGGRGPWHWVEWVNRESTGECRVQPPPVPRVLLTSEFMYDPHDTCGVYTRVWRHVPCYLCGLVTSVTCVGSGWGPMSEPVYTHRSRSQATGVRLSSSSGSGLRLLPVVAWSWRGEEAPMSPHPHGHGRQ